jgi:hypothetical protein
LRKRREDEDGRAKMGGWPVAWRREWM